MAWNLTEYAALKPVLQAIPGLSNATGKVADFLSNKIPGLGSVAPQIQNVLNDLTVDVALDTIPSLAEDIASDKSAGEVAGNAALNVGTNLGLNVLGEAAPALIKGAKNKLQSLIDVGAVKEAGESTIKQGVNAGTASSSALDAITDTIPMLDGKAAVNSTEQATEGVAKSSSDVTYLRNASATPENKMRMSHNINSFIEKPLKSSDDFVPTRYENGNGLTPYSDLESYNFTVSGQHSTSNDKSFSEFVEEALNGKGKSRYYFGKISDELAADIKSSTGDNLKGYNVSVNSQEIRHFKNDHGDPLVEEARGQIALNKDNISLIGNVFNKPDKIIESDHLDTYGRRAILFEKRLNGEAVVVTGISNGKHSLAIDSCYIKKTPTVTSDAQGLKPTSEIELQGRQTGDTGYFNSSISGNAQNVNGDNGSIAENIKKGSIVRMSNATEKQFLPRTSETESASYASDNSIHKVSENVNGSRLKENTDTLTTHIPPL